MKPRDITVLADSGSSWSLCSDNFRKYAIEIRPIPPEIILVSATNSPIRGTGIGLFHLQLGSIVVTTDMFLVDTSMSWPYTIVGLTLLEKLETVINLKTKTLTLRLEDGTSDTISYTNYASGKKSKQVSIITPIYLQPELLHDFDEEWEEMLLMGEEPVNDPPLQPAVAVVNPITVTPPEPTPPTPTPVAKVIPRVQAPREVASTNETASLQQGPPSNQTVVRREDSETSSPPSDRIVSGPRRFGES